MLDLGIKLLLSYLLGSINGSLFIGWMRGFDIRSEGSGNAGATNALRTHGPVFALMVALIDVGKGSVAVLVIASMAGFGAPLLDLAWIAVLCGLAAIVGHMFPFWFGFRGGKGGATMIGALAALNPIALLPVLGTWLLTLVITGYVSLATMLAAISVLVYGLMTGASWPMLFFGIAVAALVVFAHRSNIRGLVDGTENRATRAMFWRRRAQ